MLESINTIIGSCTSKVYELSIDESEILRADESAIGLRITCDKDVYVLWALSTGIVEIASLRGHLRGTSKLTLRKRVEVKRSLEESSALYNEISDVNDNLAWSGIDMPMHYTELDYSESRDSAKSDPKWPMPPAHLFDTIAAWWQKAHKTVFK